MNTLSPLSSDIQSWRPEAQVSHAGGDGEVSGPEPSPRVVQLDQGIEGIRGLAILLLVAYHVHNSGAFQGASATHVHQALAFVRMPLFAAISGWVFGHRPPEEGGVAAYVRKRARRLLLPVLSMGVALLFVRDEPLRLEWPGSLASAVGWLVMPREHLWFVQSLFVIVLIAVALWARGWLQTAKAWAAATVIALVIPAMLPSALRPQELIWRALCLLGYFLLGFGVQRFGCQEIGRRAVLPAIGVLALGVLAHELSWYGVVTFDSGRGGPLSLAVGVPSVLLLLHARSWMTFLAWLGPYVFAIYLIHRDGAELVRRVLLALGMPIDTGATYLLAFLAAVFLPIVAHRILVRWSLTRLLLLGLPWSKPPGVRGSVSAPRALR